VTKLLTSDKNRRVIRQMCNDDSEHSTCCLHQGRLLGQQIPLKCWYTFAGLYGVTTLLETHFKEANRKTKDTLGG
jgi:hypothetical protein